MQAPVGSVEPRRTGGAASIKAARPHTPDPGSTRGQRLGKGAHCVRVRGRSAARENGRSPYTTGPTRRSSSAHQPVSQVITRSPMHASRQAHPGAHHLLAPTALVDRRLSRAALASAGFCTCRHRQRGQASVAHQKDLTCLATAALRRTGHACRGS